ncbi:MAG: helix-turn-helix domain-containing protein [Proteobacteria bacterium]|nr:helix-turn-helix domain-containing protein [Pseudomonadota bacterium]MBU4447831.1 helix-turn-helix domain-containing protein [Pseudomonadota bacterium]
MKYKLKTLIFQSGKSQWQICQELNWPEAKLSRFVTGRRTPSPIDLEALAPVLGVSRYELQEAFN